ncbi:hypothetical protein ACFWOL_01985 [Streptomyces sp. NPDC058442]|uniref:hypothetical protein n=1 Tax=Streptomyces sp. NPDC058442 TaxID=3346503 RepID=UPI003657FA8D
MLDESGSWTRAATAAAQDDTRPRQADLAVAGGQGEGVSVSGPDRPNRQENGPVPAGSGLRVRLTATTDALPAHIGGPLRSVDLGPGEFCDTDFELSSATARRKGRGSGLSTETWQLSGDGRAAHAASPAAVTPRPTRALRTRLSPEAAGSAACAASAASGLFGPPAQEPAPRSQW